MSYYGARYYDSKTSLWLSSDRDSENDLSIGSYVYSFNNPIRFVDPDGNWPDLPSWKDVKQSYNEVKKSTSNYIAFQKEKIKGDLKNIKRELYNGKGWDDTVKDVKKIGKDIQKWTKNNKKELLTLSKNIQKTGDAMTTAGLVGAAAGAPVAGVGAAPGLAFAGGGATMSGIGKGLEVTVKFITQDPEAAADGATYIAGEMIGFGVDKIITGPNPSAAPLVKDLLKVGKETTKTMASGQAENTIKDIRKSTGQQAVIIKE